MITEALVVHEPGAPFVYQSITVEDQLRDDEVLVRIRATGVCHTDLNFAKEESVPGLFPGVFGHEGAGVVVRIGAAVTNVSTGDHVLLTYSSCGNCKYCKNHESSFCYDFEKANFGVGRSDGSKAYGTEDGSAITSHFFGQSSFSKHSIVMASSVVKIDRSLPLEDLAPLGCGIMTGAGAMINVVKPKSDDIVCVVGAGAVGLAALMALNLCSSRPTKVIAVDVVPEKLELAKKYGATHVINSRELNDLKTALLESTDGRGIDGSIDTTGRPEIVGTLLKATAKKGMVVQVGVGKLTAEVSTSVFDTVNTGRVYLGCAMGNCYPQEFIPMLVAAWKSGDFPFTELEVKYSAKDMDTAVKGILSGKVIKAIMIWD
ncbi:related to zinc-containing long-chain alcohol dehydrogenase [Rhynchosporium graminicola]|uniref:Related to zinc-containing long-chain alcohol dehydrogenase n=1 Tax=Rhynchosporium graminicola TaxID=2792576 RepID=A0A1E1LM36_9HELO|nr:related to zinc-containing long-chain alcohol dehydrogenase [Rhynchosporium commune]